MSERPLADYVFDKVMLQPSTDDWRKLVGEGKRVAPLTTKDGVPFTHSEVYKYPDGSAFTADRDRCYRI